MRRRLCLLLVLVWASPALPQAGPARVRAGPASSPCDASVANERVVGVSTGGEVTLASGLTVHLADLRWTDEPEFRSAGLKWLREQVGQAVAVRARLPDRWNRLSAQIVLAEAPAPLPVARHLVREGFALVDPGEAEGLCDRSLLAAEAEARRERRGLWAGELAQPLPAHRAEALRERIGAFVIVEGRVRSVGKREQRTYLNFGRTWSEDFTVTIPKRSWTILSAAGVQAAALRGRRVRVRGVLEEWNGPALTLHAPEMLELLDPEPTPP